MLEEMRALKKNEIWETVDLSKGRKLVSCKWIFTIKHKVEGSLERYNARLVFRIHSH